MKYPVYHAHKSTMKLKLNRLARALAKPVAFTFLGLVLCAVASNKLLAEQRIENDALKMHALMDKQEVLPPPVI
jgi:hypothetical protein